MARANTARSYGSVSRTLHWAVAALILTAIPLGLAANRIPLDSDASIARAAALFSVHKSVGVAACLLAAARILWALTQPRPVPVHPGRRVETFVAGAVHWTLYAAIVLVPVTGWIGHAATSGAAPILWPFGQSLPLVPKDPGLAEGLFAFHRLFTKVLIAAVALHILGAAKHMLVDRDATLARMVTGAEAGDPARREGRAPILAAGALWIAAILAGVWLAVFPGGDAQPRPIAWVVEDGVIDVAVTAQGERAEGGFLIWTADLTWDPEAPGPLRGRLEVTVVLETLDLGEATDAVLAALDTAGSPTAAFSADLSDAPGGALAEGTLFLNGIDKPLRLPVAVTREGDTLRFAAELTLDRRDFGIGPDIPDETLGPEMEVRFDFVATP